MSDIFSEEKFYLATWSIKIGLFNQLISIINSIIVGIYNKRNIVLGGFYPQYDDDNTIAISQIINLQHMNKFLTDYNIKVLDYQSIDKNIIWKRSSYANLFTTANNFNDNNYLKSLSLVNSENDTHIDLYRVFGLDLFFNDNLKKLKDNIFDNLKFADIFYEIKDYCKCKFNLHNYNVIHLRIEDDVIEHLIYHRYLGKNLTKNVKKYKIKIFLINKYLEFLTQYTNKNIYVCTHLLKSKNENNDYFVNLKKKHKMFINDDEWRTKYTIAHGREIGAIIDYLIALDGEAFLGYNGSTFSKCIHNIYENANKKTQLIVL